MSSARIYTSEQLDDFEERGELYVCPYCDYHGNVDDFGDICPRCHVNFEDPSSFEEDENSV